MKTLNTSQTIICSLSTLILSASTVLASEAITISPTGDTSGVLDQQNIQFALDNANNGKINLKFKKGLYYILGGVSAYGLKGELSGKGGDKTTIIAVGEGQPVNRNSIFLINDSELTFRNFTIKVDSEAKYLDSSPGLGISDGGAAIDVIGGNVEIKNINLITEGPFQGFGEEDLETGILVSGCQGKVTISNSYFEGVKRSIIFNPVVSSNCEVEIQNNHFFNNRGAVFALGGTPVYSSNTVFIKNNQFNNTLVGEIFLGNGVEYPITVNSNAFSNDGLPGNPAIFARNIKSDLTVTNNKFFDDRQSPIIGLIDVVGNSQIIGNKIEGSPTAGVGTIYIDSSDNVLINSNDFNKNDGITGFDLSDTSSVGAYQLVFSTNVTIKNEKHNKNNLENCQVLNIPFIDTTNYVDNDLIQCAPPSQ